MYLILMRKTRFKVLNNSIGLCRTNDKPLGNNKLSLYKL